jgi:hypothetical protein
VRLPGAQLTAIEVNGGPYLDDWRKMANAGGFAEKAFLYACDEPGSNRRHWKGCKQAARQTKRWPGLEALATGTIRAADRFKASGALDILVPIVNWIDDREGAYAGDQRPTYDEFLAAGGKELWLYTACPSHGCAGDPGGDPYYEGWPSYVIDQPPSEHRSMGMIAFEYGATGELYFDTTSELKRAWKSQFAFGGNGDGTLFYPGTPKRVGGSSHIPIESIRLKRIRDGHEDYEYLNILAARGQGAEAMAIARGLFPTPYETNVSPADFFFARLGLIRLIEAG